MDERIFEIHRGLCDFAFYIFEKSFFINIKRKIKRFLHFPILIIPKHVGKDSLFSDKENLNISGKTLILVFRIPVPAQWMLVTEDSECSNIHTDQLIMLLFSQHMWFSEFFARGCSINIHKPQWQISQTKSFISPKRNICWCCFTSRLLIQKRLKRQS